MILVVLEITAVASVVDRNDHDEKVSDNEGGEGEVYDPVASAFRVKLVRDDVLLDCRFRGLRREGGAGDR